MTKLENLYSILRASLMTFSTGAVGSLYQKWMRTMKNEKKKMIRMTIIGTKVTETLMEMMMTIDCPFNHRNSKLTVSSTNYMA